VRESDPEVEDMRRSMSSASDSEEECSEEQGEEGKEPEEYLAEVGVGRGGRGKPKGLSLNVMLKESGLEPSVELLAGTSSREDSAVVDLNTGITLACLLPIFALTASSLPPSDPLGGVIIIVKAGDGARRACSSEAIENLGASSSSESSCIMCRGCLRRD
jgi:hypothetical protein